MKYLILAITGVFASEGVALAEPILPLQGEPIVMNTLSTPQFYGPTLGFHHGLDLLAPAGTPIYAPVSGWVEMRNYYPRANTPYTYEVSIQTEAGYRWELHHIDSDYNPSGHSAARPNWRRGASRNIPRSSL